MCAWVRRDTRGQPHPRGIEQQKNALLARDVSTKRETRYWAFRTLWHCEVLTGAYQTLRQRRSLLQLQHHHRCQTLGDFLSRGRDSNRNTFVVLNVVQILQPSEEPRTTASCCSFFRRTGGQQLTQESVVQLRHLDRATCVACDTNRSRRCERCSFCKSDTPTRDLIV